MQQQQGQAQMLMHDYEAQECSIEQIQHLPEPVMAERLLLQHSRLMGIGQDMLASWIKQGISGQVSKATK